MILKCKQKIEYECIAYDGTNLDDLMPFIQDSKNLISVYQKKEIPLAIGLGIVMNREQFNCNCIFPVDVGDYIIKYPNKKIMMISKKEFEEQYDIINEEKNE